VDPSVGAAVVPDTEANRALRVAGAPVACPALHRMELEDGGRSGFISAPRRGSGCVTVLEPVAGAIVTGDSLGVGTTRSWPRVRACAGADGLVVDGLDLGADG
jgi:hypothetical protein